MLGSKRMWPICICASLTPRYCTSICNSRANAATLSGVSKSGSVTISNSGVPARLRSTML